MVKLRDKIRSDKGLGELCQIYNFSTVGGKGERVHFEVKRSKVKVTATVPGEGIAINGSPSTSD